MSRSLAHKTTPRRVIIWRAVSSEAQVEDKISLSDQEARGRAWVAAHDAVVIDVLTVPGHSRYEADIVEALEELRAGGVAAYDDLKRHWKARDFDVLWAYHPSRFGRSKTLYSYVIENTVRSGAVVQCDIGGEINAGNFDISHAMSAIQATEGIQRLVQGRAAGMIERAARGMHVNSKLPFFHIEDASGRMVVDRQRYERLIADLFVIVVDQRTAWDGVEVELNARGHVAPDGLLFRRHFFRNVIYTPAFWGNVGVGYGSRKRGNRERREWYMIEPGHEIPPGVTMFYGVCEAVYDQPDAERLKAELRRREAIRGRMTPARTRPFSGLLVCAECGHNLRYVHVYGSGYKGYTCASRYIAQRGYRTTYDCTQRTSIPFDDIVSYFDNLIRAMLAATDPVRLLYPLPTPRDTSAALERELTDVEAQIVRLTARLASVPDAVAGDVLAYLERLGERRKTLHAQQIDARTTRLQADQRSAAIRSALGQIDLARFWSQPEAVIHQQLHALMDGVKVEVLDGVIVALRPKT